MSKFLKALEQAERDRAMAGRGRAETASAAPVPPIGAASPTARLVDDSAPRRTPPPSEFRKPPTPPRTPVEILEGVDDHLVSLVTPTAFEAEQYRALRYIVEQRHRTDNLSVLAISSPAVGDGKSMTAVNLAGALGQAPEGRVLLIEADLRRPSLGELLGFGSTGQRGLVDAILDRNLTLSDVAVTRPPFNMSIVLAGQTPPSPYEVLKSPRLAELLDEARANYEYIILDTPPLVSLQDCRVIARWVDGIILVVAAHQTPKRLIEEALNVIDPTKMLGFVFNGDDQGFARLYAGHRRAYSTPAAAKNGGWSRALKKVGAPFTRRDRGHEGDDQ